MIQCKQCLLNSTVSEVFSVDEKGICNYCNYYTSAVKALGTPEQRSQWLKNKITEIKNAGSGREYDCILGVSGV
jgi:sensor histidine kinase regulating citrate/malate metabolism